MEICPVCCKPIKVAKYMAYCNDDNGGMRYVGADCWKRVRAAKERGYKQPGDPGPLWFANRGDALAATP